MIAFIVFINFILIALALFLIILLFSRMNRIQGIEKKQEKMMKELEDVISSTLMQMSEENELFLQKLVQSTDKMDHANGYSLNLMDQPVMTQMKKASEQNHEKLPNPSDDSLLPLTDCKDVIEISTSSKVSEKIKKKTTNELFIDEVKGLYKEGLSVEQIAKQLNKGKTEIELLIKFNGNK